MIFMHMNEPPNQYSTGQKVLAGTQLGTIGSTGRSTGAHGHFEVYAMNEPTHLPNTVYRFSSTRGAYTIDPVYFLNRVAAGR